MAIHITLLFKQYPEPRINKAVHFFSVHQEVDAHYLASLAEITKSASV